MDISKFCIPTLDGPNFGLWLDHIQSTTRILDIWDIMRGDLITSTTPPTRDLLTKLSPLAPNASQDVINTCHCESHLEQEERSRSRPNPSNSLQCDLAETPISANIKGSSGRFVN